MHLCGVYESPKINQYTSVIIIPNGCFDADEVVNKAIFKYQEKVKLISQFQRFFFIFQWLIRVSFIPIK